MRPSPRAPFLVTLLAILALIAGAASPFVVAQTPSAPGATPVGSGTSDWPMYRADAARTGAVDGPALEGQPVELWRLELDAPAFRSPAVVGGVLYIGRQDGLLQALEAATGDEIWSFQADAAVQVTPAVANGIVIIGSERGTLYGIDAGSGEELWQFAKPLTQYSLPVMADNVLYMGSDDGFLYAIDATSGEETWAFEAGVPLTRGAAVAGGMVFIGSEDGKLFAVNVADGTEAWRFEDGVPGERTTTPTVGDGVVYFAQGGILHAHDAVSGDEVWQSALGDGARAPAYYDGTVYTAGTDGVVYAIDGASGDVVWTFQAEDQFTSTPAVVGGIVYAANWGGFLYALDRETGAEQWRFAIEGDVDNGPSYAGGVLYLSTSFGILYAIGGSGEVGTGTPAGVSTPSAVPAGETPAASPVAGIENPVELVWESTGGPEPIVAPGNVELDPEGNVWVLDGGHNRFQILTPEGEFVETWGSEGDREGEFNFIRDPADPFSAAGGVAFAPDGSFYVVEAANRRVQKFDAERNFVTSWGEFGIEDGQFVDPIGIAVDGDGNVFVIDDERDDVQKFDADGNFLLKFGGHGSEPGQLAYTGFLTVDYSGNVWVADFDNHRVQQFSGEGELLQVFGAFGDAEGQFNHPVDVELDKAGHVYVADIDNGRVQVLNDQGAFLATWGADGADFAVPVALELDAEGHIYVTDLISGVVLKYQLLPPLGQAVEQASPIAGSVVGIESPAEHVWTSGPIGFAVSVGISPDGTLWVPDLEGQVIHTLSPDDGTLVEDWTDEDAGEGTTVTMAEVPIAAVVFTDDGGFYAAYVNGVIQRFDADRQFVQAWGGLGTGKGQFVEIGGISLDGVGNVYVPDIGQGNIQKFTAEGEYLMTIGEQGTGPGQFDGPSAPSFDAEGNMYVADFRNQRISKLTPDGGFITSWGTQGTGPGEVGNPDAVKLDDAGNMYIADEQNHRVQVWDPEGRFLAMWGEFGTADGQFSYVANITLDGEGNIYVNDIENRRVQKFRLLPPLGEVAEQASPMASPVMSVEEPVELLWEFTGGPEPLTYPADVALDSEGNVWILDAANNRFQIVSPEGTFIETWGAAGSGEGQFNFVRVPNEPISAVGGIAFAPDGHFYVADTTNQRIQKFDAGRNFVTAWGEPGTGDGQFLDPYAVAVDGEGNVFVADDQRHDVQKFDQDGTFVLKFGEQGSEPGQLNGPALLTVAPDGNVWVA